MAKKAIAKNKIGKKIHWSRYATIFVLAGIIYVFMEVAFTALIFKMRGYSSCISYFAFMGCTSVYMFFIGGLLGLLLGGINEIKFLRRHLNMFFQALTGAVLITAVEFISGYILNIIFKFNLWSYSDIAINGVPLNVEGQICLPFTVIWFFIAPVAFWFDDTVRALVYHEGEAYSLGWAYKQLFNPKLPSWNHPDKKIRSKIK
jgi:uncharacterized membrane protein